MGAMDDTREVAERVEAADLSQMRDVHIDDVYVQMD